MQVMTTEELQRAVAELPTEQLDVFSQWFEEFLADQWDRRIAAILQAVRGDAADRLADEPSESDRWASAPR